MISTTQKKLKKFI